MLVPYRMLMLQRMAILLARSLYLRERIRLPVRASWAAMTVRRCMRPVARDLIARSLILFFPNQAPSVINALTIKYVFFP
jgi:hypothetical protein